MVTIEVNEDVVIPIAEKPHERHIKLYKKLEEEITQLRTEQWRQKDNLHINNIKETDKKSKSGYEEDILDDEIEEEFTDSESDEENELCDFEETDEQKTCNKKSIFIDDEVFLI